MPAFLVASKTNTTQVSAQRKKWGKTKKKGKTGGQEIPHLLLTDNA